MIPDFPKLQCPYRRDPGAGWRITPDINPDIPWAATQPFIAVEKLNGTNCAVELHDGWIVGLANRKEQFPWPRLLRGSRTYANLVGGVFRAADYGYLDHLEDGIHYGELIGPGIQGNPYGLSSPLWVPFTYLQSCCAYPTFPPLDDFEKVCDTLKNLTSKFAATLPGAPYLWAEGVVLYFPNAPMLKLRRNMAP